jgi:hypothetical protein
MVFRRESQQFFRGNWRLFRISMGTLWGDNSEDIVDFQCVSRLLADSDIVKKIIWGLLLTNR